MLLALVAGEAPAQDKILWLKTDWSPVFMPDGKGFGDAVLTWLQSRLPANYSHETRRLPLPRLLKMMEDRQVITCTSNLLRTPAREAQFLISRDVMRMPALGLVVRGGEADAFRALRDERGMVEFRRLLHRPDLDGAINENRAYGAALDSLLRDPTITAPLIRLSKTSTMVSMLAANRVDWILLYPFEAIWLAREEQAIPALSTLGIAEIPAFNRGGVTCNHAPGAERLVAAINDLIESHPDEPWLAPMYAWLDPETRQRLSASR